jgi:hypothetical protein
MYNLFFNVGGMFDFTLEFMTGDTSYRIGIISVFLLFIVIEGLKERIGGKDDVRKR